MKHFYSRSKAAFSILTDSFTAFALPLSACIGRTYRAVLLVSLLCFFGPAAALYAQTQFITKWDLSKTGTSTTALTFGVQVAAAGAATYTWNTVPAGTSGSGTIAASAISVTISGLPAGAMIEVKINPTNFQRIDNYNGTDQARLVDVSQWGTTAWTSMATAFWGCYNLNITATDVPILTGVTSMSNMFVDCSVLNGPSNIGTWNTAAVTIMASMFQGATAFNQNISTWTTTAVTNMAQMFYVAPAFNQNIGTWNVAAVTNMSRMLSDATAFNQSLAAWGTKFNAAVNLTNCLNNCGMSMANYEATLAGFALTTRTGRSLGAAGLKYCNASARTILTNTVASGGKGWTITGDVQDCATATFVTRWDLSKTGTSTTALTFGVVVASTGAATYTWNTVPTGTSGSGTIAASATSVTISGLPANATIEVKINPTNFQRININTGTDKARLIDVSQWGTTAWTSMQTAFYGCNNLNITATDVPNLVGVTNMSSMFNGCSALNSPSNIGMWNTTAATDMSFMFYQATAFNQNIGAWNTAAVTSTSSIFRDATAFNQNIGSWNTTKVTDMSLMFFGATAFNQNIETWNTAAVTNMASMFYNAPAFNQNIGAWTTTAVTNMAFMFASATAFNQNIGTWTTTAVTNMSYMFYNTTAFNQNIGTWNVAAVTNMSNMFFGATAFNQNIGTWNVAAVTDMSSMFRAATAFNQSLAAWGTKFNAAVNLTNCLDNCGMSMTNYEATLAGFALTTRTGRSLGAAGLKYCNTSGRTILTTATPTGKGWTITGDVQDCATSNFVTRWDLSKTGASTTALTFGVVVASTGAATYTWNTVPAGTSGSGTIAASATSVTISGLPANATIEVKINPTNFQRININTGTDKARLIDVSQWGTTAWTSMQTAFYGCNNLNITATDVPNLTGVTSMSQMFFGCSVLNGPSNIGTWNMATVTNILQMFSQAKAFNQNIGTWNTANVTNMVETFAIATAFNQNIGTWNTAKVTDMSGMFASASTFNQDIGAWNTAAVTNMSTMFTSATAFNQNISTWNTVAVTNMSRMFNSATAFNQNIGIWNTAAVTNMSTMFQYATAFNQNISTWNTVKVTDMSYMFFNATAFNQDIGTWTTTAVINMSNMFYGATVFNQDIGTWTTTAVINMSNMFYGATVFNGNIGAWNTIKVTNMSNMFYNATAFNQPIGTWTTAAVTNMSYMFYNATAFNQNIGTWTTTAVTNMSGMFYNATAFNGNIGAWNTAAVTDMSQMFYNATAFNQNIGTWNTAAVTNMSGMFYAAPAFNQNIGTWNVAAVTNMFGMFYQATAYNQSLAAWGTKFNALVNLTICLDNCGMSMANYEATLAGFALTTRTGRSLGAAGLKYCNTSARTTLTTATPTGKGWTITGDVQNCATANFVTRWDLSKTGASTTALTFGVVVASTGAATYTWTNVGTGVTSAPITLAANATTLSITGLPANAIIEVKINPTNFQSININNGADKARLVDVSQWGTTVWTSMANAFVNCNNLNITATDVPNLAGVTNMSYMFQGCSVLNGPSNMGVWNTASIVNMSAMFSGTPVFNQNIGTWNTAAVTNMSAMFNATIAFNQDISAWNVAAVTNMSSMFYFAYGFNQNISAWNIAATTNMSYTFSYATAYNQSLAAWCTKFNALVNLTGFLDNCGMSIANYEATLAGFALTTRTGRSLGATGLKYCNASARTILTNTVASGGKGWTITGDVQDCATATFVTRWNLSKTGASTTALTFGVAVASTGAATYTWNTVPAGTSGSGTMAANATSVTISGLPANAIIEVKINPTNFQRININTGTDKARLIDVLQWGTTAWTSMAQAFYGCNNLNITATDVPTLTGVTNMSNMFLNCSVLNGPSNIGTWNTAAVTSMFSMFYGATAFNQPIGTWNTAAVTNMSNMFLSATAFNQNIDTWTTTAVTNMSGMFGGTTAFNQNIGTWNTAAVTNMSYMFGGATAFNQNISAWNVAAVTDMTGMFGATTAFNQNISAWNVAAVTNMYGMFQSAVAFNQNIDTWNVAAVTNMSSMFYKATAFNQPISTWNTIKVTDMSIMFTQATAFNQNISTWNVAAVTNMSNIFNGATAFNQSLAAWGTKFNAAVVLTHCLSSCGMSVANYEATLTGFAATTRTGITLGAADLKYCNATDRTILTNPVASGGKGWTIIGDAVVTAPSTPTFTAGATALCTGATSSYTATSANSSSITYSILNGTGASINASSGLVSNITGDFTVVATAANTCSATTTANRAVTINANVTPSVSITASPSGVITAGTSVIFTATPTNGGATPAYQWKNGSIDVGTGTTYTSTTLANADVITCVITPSAEICVSATTATSAGITMTVNAACDCDPTCSPIPTAAGTYTATRSNVIGLYTHYCSGNNLLLSVKTPTNGTVVPFGAVKVKVGATTAVYLNRFCGETVAANYCFVSLVGGGVIINRNWHIDSALVTGPVIGLTNQLQIVSYFTTGEYTALNFMMTANSLTPLTNNLGLKLYQPSVGRNFGAFPNPSLIKPLLSVTKHSNGASPSTTLWQYANPQTNSHSAEFKVSSLQNSGGIGKPF